MSQEAPEVAGAPFISIVVATYNRHRELNAVLRSLTKQSSGAYEVVVADDGSGQETAEVVKDWQNRWSGPIRHVWQEDSGFRLAEIRNKAIAACRGDYVVFLDGDCIAPSDFVAGHRRMARAGWMVCGHRLMLTQDLSQTILDDDLPIEDWALGAWLDQFRRGSIDRLMPLVRLPDGAWRLITARGRENKVRGCNMAVWRSDLLKVDGFDAEFVGWGHEDNDLARRLRAAGVALKDGRWATGVFHLWHPPADRAQEHEHWAWIEAAGARHRIKPRRGLSSL